MKNVNHLQIPLSVLTLVIGVAALCFYIISVSTDWWIFTRQYYNNGIAEGTNTNSTTNNQNFYTSVHFGLWNFCIDLDTHGLYSSGCHVITTQCETDIGFGDFTVLGLREFGHCDAYNTTRVFVVLAVIFAGLAVITHSFSWAASNAKSGIVGMVCYFVSSLMGLLGMAIWCGKIYYLDGLHWTTASANPNSKDGGFAQAHGSYNQSSEKARIRQTTVTDVECDDVYV
eukprot:Pgem_evm1s3513